MYCCCLRTLHPVQWDQPLVVRVLLQSAHHEGAGYGRRNFQPAVCLNLTAPSSVGKLDAEKQFVLDELLPPKGVVTAMHLTSSLFCAPHGNVTAHTWVDRGLHASRFYSIEPGERLHGCFSACMQTHRRCTLWTTCLPPEPSQKRKTCFRN